MTFLHWATPKDFVVISTLISPYLRKHPYLVSYGCMKKQIETKFEPMVKSSMGFIADIVAALATSEEVVVEDPKSKFKLLQGGKVHKDLVQIHMQDMLDHLESMEVEDDDSTS